MKCQTEKIITDVLKTAMPHLDLKNDKSVDLYFELLEPQEKSEIFEDLVDGKDIGLPDFSQAIKNNVKKLNKEDFNDKNRELQFIDKFVKQKIKNKPILEYDENQHKYKMKKAADSIFDLNRLLKLNFDDKIVSQGQKFLNILDKIEIRADDVITKNEISDIKEDLRKNLQQTQDIWERMFALQQRLTMEEE